MTAEEKLIQQLIDHQKEQRIVMDRFRENTGQQFKELSASIARLELKLTENRGAAVADHRSLSAKVSWLAGTISIIVGGFFHLVRSWMQP